MVLGNQPLPVSAVSQTVNKRENLLNNKYVVMEEVGRGAYGVVRRGRDVATNEEVAIKEVKLTGSSQEQLQDVMTEIDLLKSLNHEHIVKYLDSFKTRTTLYIILEFMEKGDLSSTLKPSKFGVFPEPLAAVYIAQVLQGLVYLHEQGVVHRDIKGANILTTKEVCCTNSAFRQHSVACKIRVIIQ
jgi:serine/threonine protein kinase